MQSSMHLISLMSSLSISDSINMNARLFFSLLTLICLLSIGPFSEARKNHSSFSFDLIHIDSPLSPFYNSSMTHSERTRNAALRSVARFNEVHHQFSSLNEENDQSPESIITPNGGGDYLMRIYIGTPPVEKYAIADTGSNLIWVQCSPCEGNCFPQDTPLFDPSKSSTYMPLSCDSQACSLLPQGHQSCGPSKECKYSNEYGDNSSTNGVLSLDSINFGSTSEGQGVNFPKSIFGCGYNNSGIFTKRDTGIVGLGAGKLSLVSQLSDQIGHKFSYCLVDPSNSNSNSKLKFGDEAIISRNGVVVSTPFTINPSSSAYYYLTLQGISVGQNTVRSGQNGGNIIIDSGSTLTSLESSFYNNFVDSVKEALGVEAVQNPPRPYNFCFEYNGARVNYPQIVFHFSGANVFMKPEINLFAADGNLHCLLVVPAKPNGVSIFGNVAQINFQVEYDLEGKTVSFAPTDCANN